MVLRKDGEGVVILVPGKIVDSGIRVAWKLQHWLTLSKLQNSNLKNGVLMILTCP